MEWREDGVAFVSDLASGEFHPAGTAAGDIAVAWAGFCIAVSRGTLIRHEAARAEWEKGLAAARSRPLAA